MIAIKKFQFHLLLFLLVQPYLSCTDFVSNNPSFDCPSPIPLLSTRTGKYYQLEQERLTHFLIESKEPVNQKLLENYNGFFEVEDKKKINQNYYVLLYNSKNIETLKQYTTKDDIGDIFTFMGHVTKKVKKMNNKGLFVEEINQNNILISTNNGKVSFLDLGVDKAEIENMEELKKKQVKLLIEVYLELSKDANLYVQSNSNMEQKIKFKITFDFVNKKLKEIEQEGSGTLDDLLIYFNPFPGKKQEVSLEDSQKKIVVKKSTYSIVGMRNINIKHICFALSVSVVLICALVMTIALMSKKVPNLSDDDLEMLVLKHNGIDTFYI